MVVKEDGAVENGDTVNIDFDGYVDGEQFEGDKQMVMILKLAQAHLFLI